MRPAPSIALLLFAAVIGTAQAANAAAEGICYFKVGENDQVIFKKIYASEEACLKARVVVIEECESRCEALSRELDEIPPEQLPGIKAPLSGELEVEQSCDYECAEKKPKKEDQAPHLSPEELRARVKAWNPVKGIQMDPPVLDSSSSTQAMKAAAALSVGAIIYEIAKSLLLNSLRLSCPALFMAPIQNPSDSLHACATDESPDRNQAICRRLDNDDEMYQCRILDPNGELRTFEIDLMNDRYREVTNG